MSIEKDLSRIADSLENIEKILTAGGIKQPVKTGKPAPVDPLEQEIDAGAAVETEFVIADATELRNFAQKVIVNAGENSPAVIDYIKGLCTKINPKEPKLIKIPADKVQEVANNIKAFAEKSGISIE